MLLLLGLNPSRYDKSAAWTERSSHGTPWIQQLVSHQSYIWISTAWSQGASGMMQYCTKTDSITSVHKYPPEIKCKYHSICKHGNTIYIIDGRLGEIISFSISTKQFTKLKTIPKVGAFCTSIVIHSHIHIFNGDRNTKHHLVYSIQNGTVQIVKDETTSNNSLDSLHRKPLESVAVLQYKRRMIRFGGFVSKSKRSVDQLWISSPVNSFAPTQITWTLQPDLSLKTPLSFSGYVLYRHYVLTFGGYTNRKKCSDLIYSLDLRGDGKWKEVQHIRCPLASCYQAIIIGEDGSNPTVHLFTGNNTDNVTKHWTVPISNIIEIEDDDDDLSTSHQSLHHRLHSLSSLHSLSPIQCGECSNCTSLKNQVAELVESQKEMKQELERIKQNEARLMQQIEDLKQSNAADSIEIE